MQHSGREIHAPTNGASHGLHSMGKDVLALLPRVKVLKCRGS